MALSQIPAWPSTMRILIDGYNLMYARGLLGRPLGAEGFRKARRRFLSDLAEALDPIDAHQSTVVFDASSAPEHLPDETSFKGITVVYAVDNENADERIEILIAQHANPKQLTVVSSDHRVRQAAVRRKATSLTSEEFLEKLEAPAAKRKAQPAERESPAERARRQGLSPEEAAAWEHEFRDLIEDVRTRDQLRSEPPLLTDAEIAELEREIDQEP